MNFFGFLLKVISVMKVRRFTRVFIHSTVSYQLSELAICVGDDFSFSCRARLCHGNAAVIGALHAVSDIVCQTMKVEAVLSEL